MYTITDDTIHDHVYCSRRLAAHVMAIEMTMINAEFFPYISSQGMKKLKLLM